MLCLLSYLQSVVIPLFLTIQVFLWYHFLLSEELSLAILLGWSASN